MGFFGAGMWGVVPTYLSERFPTAVRGWVGLFLSRRRGAGGDDALRRRRAPGYRVGAA